MSKDFRFKQFSISQSKAPMKVGTDGVLLGAWCQGKNAINALDIGTGTGLIAMMLAQRFSALKIQAIEPNAQAYEDAQSNISLCKWADRIRLKQIAVEDYLPESKLDLIVSNPPFFHGDLKAPDLGRNMARHASGFDFKTFLECSSWLSNHGILAGIYPKEIFDKMAQTAFEMGLHFQEICMVKPTPEKSAHRVLFSLGKQGLKKPRHSELIIESEGRHQYSQEYQSLTSDFYLKF